MSFWSNVDSRCDQNFISIKCRVDPVSLLASIQCYNVISIKCHFEKVSLRSNVISIRFDQTSLRSYVISTIYQSMGCRFDQMWSFRSFVNQWSATLRMFRSSVVFIKCRTHCWSNRLSGSSGWYLRARKKPIYTLLPDSQKFPQRCLWNISNVRLTDDGPFWHPLKEDHRKL